MRVAVDLGGTKIFAAVEGREGPGGPFLAQRKVPTEAGRGGEAVFETLVRAIDEVVKDAGGQPLTALGVCVPGIVEPGTGRVMDCSNLPGWDQFPLGDRLRERYGISVCVDNDARAACWAEATTGAAAGARNMAFVTFSTGIGAGFVLDGRLYRGTRGVAGELGETKDDSGEPVERRSAGPALERMFGIPAVELRSRYDAGDPQARLAFDHLVGTGGRLLANLATLIDPEVIVVGGGLSHLGPWFLEALQARVRSEAYSLARETRLVSARWGVEAGVRGMLSLP